jgi:3-hydroxymyristoyl/3-hydroxydecanoyl-(acyl carrier protein) dehydratase
MTAAIENEGGARQQAGRFVIAPDHPALAGHFPGHPIVPGVVLLDRAITRIGAALARPAERLESFEIIGAKFLSPVSPGEVVAIDYESGASGVVRFTLSVAGRVVATGTLSLPASGGTAA